MNDIRELMLAGAAGVLLGLIFFGGLWWTVRRALDSPRSGLWVAASLLLRMGIVAVGFVVVGAGDWRRLLSCLSGFLFARWLVVRLTAERTVEPSPAARLSLALASGRSRVNSTVAKGRAQSSRPEGAEKRDGGDIR